MKDYLTSYTHKVSEFRWSIMGLSMLSIMLFHQYFTSTIPFNFFHNFGYWGVDVFLFLSGMGLVRSLTNNRLKTYYIHRFNRIIPSCILCGSFKYIIFLLLGESVAILQKGLNIGIWSIVSFDLWFIPSIIIIYIIAPALYLSIRKWPYQTILITMSVFILNGIFIRPGVGFDWMSPIGIFSYTTERLPVFLAGMYTVIKEEWIDGKIGCSFLFLIAAFIFAIIEKIGITYHGVSTCKFFLLMMGMPALIYLCVSLLSFLPDKLIKAIDFFGKYSLELYLVHEFIFWTMIIKCDSGNPYFMLVIGFVLSCLTAYLCKYLTIKIKTIHITHEHK